jgi:hypothetical protein
MGRGFILTGGFGVDRVRFLADGLYEPADDGPEALILGAWSGLPNISELVDRVAVRIGGAERWAPRRGNAVALGEHHVSELSEAPVGVFRSPWSWLRAEACGVWVVADDVIEVRDLLLACPAIVAETVDLGRAIDDAMRRHWNRLPPVYVAEQARAA